MKRKSEKGSSPQTEKKPREIADSCNGAPNEEEEKEIAAIAAEARIYQPHSRIASTAHVQSLQNYKELYASSIKDPASFWEKAAKESLTWFRPFSQVFSGSFEKGDIAWFHQGKLNACYQCVDRHVFPPIGSSTPSKADKVAIIWEGDDPSAIRRITYRELYSSVCQLANALRAYGIRKGDVVAIYMPMVPEAAIAMLACARIGAMHSVVFGGFSAVALRDRIIDARCKLLITADEGYRGGRIIPLKHTVEEALIGIPSDLVTKVFVLRRSPNSKIPWNPDRDLLLDQVMQAQRPYCPVEEMDSEDPLFLLYTSGSTGKPKGLMHSTAGYLLYTSLTHKIAFDLHEDDVYACVADVGWITGHSYVVYGPLTNGSTTTLFESLPTYPTPSRYWEMIERHKISIFYTAPTAIRALMKFGDDLVTKTDRSSLRILGTVGEPINPSAWMWYHNVVGESKCAIVDTYWQTETGGFIITPLPGATPVKPGSATLPFFGIRPAILDAKTGEEITGSGRGVLAIAAPWPGIGRTVYGDHDRYLSTYMKPYPGYYLTGDGALRDEDGFYWITGRVDDVMNVSGHRIGTAELESALVSHPGCAEAAVVAVHDDVKGSAIYAFCILKEGFDKEEDTERMRSELRNEVRKRIGPFATPKAIVITPGLPKTRSGKIMRRVLRKIASKETSSEQLGDISTLADSKVVQVLIGCVEQAKG